jgi:hypothetical protein
MTCFDLIRAGVFADPLREGFLERMRADLERIFADQTAAGNRQFGVSRKALF